MKLHVIYPLKEYLQPQYFTSTGIARVTRNLEEQGRLPAWYALDCAQPKCNPLPGKNMSQCFFYCCYKYINIIGVMLVRVLVVVLLDNRLCCV